jgi:hypothetical protein
VRWVNSSFRNRLYCTGLKTFGEGSEQRAKPGDPGDRRGAAPCQCAENSQCSAAYSRHKMTTCSWHVRPRKVVLKRSGAQSRQNSVRDSVARFRPNSESGAKSGAVERKSNPHALAFGARALGKGRRQGFPHALGAKVRGWRQGVPPLHSPGVRVRPVRAGGKEIPMHSHSHLGQGRQKAARDRLSSPSVRHPLPFGFKVPSSPVFAHSPCSGKYLMADDELS